MCYVCFLRAFVVFCASHFVLHLNTKSLTLSHIHFSVSSSTLAHIFFLSDFFGNLKEHHCSEGYIPIVFMIFFFPL